MRVSVLGLALIAPVVVLAAPAAAQNGPTFGYSVREGLGLTASCPNVDQWIGTRYSSLGGATPSSILRNGARTLDVNNAFGTYMADVDGDGRTDADLGGSGGLPGSSSSSSGPPLEYVRVASIYGTGFYYIPGTDTCLRIGGWVRADYQYYNDGGGNTNSVFSARSAVTFDARQQTAYGTVRGYFAVEGVVGLSLDPFGTFREAGVSRAFVQFAGFTFGQSGRTGTVTMGLAPSTYDYATPFTYYGVQSNETLFQIRTSTIINNGWNLDVALENPEGRGLPSDWATIVAGFGPPNGSWRGSVALSDTPWGLGLAGQFGATVNVTPQWSVRGVVSVARYLSAFVGFGTAGPDNYAGINISGKYDLGQGWNIVGGFGAAGEIGGGMDTTMGIGVRHNPNANTTFGVDLYRNGNGGGGDTRIVFRIQRDFVP
jgi:hypothetical protein